MAIWRSALLEELLGGPLDDTGLTAAALHALCRDAIAENDELEFKSIKAYAPQPKKPGGIPWSNDQEFAKDVCAFANHCGGIILIGVDERENVAAKVSVAGRTDPHREHQRLGQALQQLVSPPVRVDYLPIPVDQDYATAVIVPASADAPHGVAAAPASKRRSMCFPVRDGAHTRYLAEAELADRYQRRFLGATERRAREDRVVDEGCAALRRSPEHEWCYLAVVPSVATDPTINREIINQFAQWLRTLNADSPLNSMVVPSGPPIPGPGRLTITDHPDNYDDDLAQPREGYLELHADASFFGARQLQAQDEVSISPLHLADAVIQLTDLGLRWATERVGEWGSASVICGLQLAEQRESLLLQPHNRERLPPSPLRSRGRRVTPASAPVARSVADLSAVHTMRDRMIVAYEAGSGLVQHFGLAEMLQLAPDGALNSDAWAEAHSWAADWAKRCEIEVGSASTRRSPYMPTASTHLP